jgi:hypothetical protein
MSLPNCHAAMRITLQTALNQSKASCSNAPKHLRYILIPASWLLDLDLIGSNGRRTLGEYGFAFLSHVKISSLAPNLFWMKRGENLTYSVFEASTLNMLATIYLDFCSIDVRCGTAT